jgi:hypothetical protein
MYQKGQGWRRSWVVVAMAKHRLETATTPSHIPLSASPQSQQLIALLDLISSFVQSAMPAHQPPLVLPRDPHEITLPIPHPPLLTRNSNMSYENGPSTPTANRSYNDFVTPQQTPQGSPSKHQAPPGAFDLPTTFDSSLRLYPTTGGASIAHQQPTSPTKQLPPTRLPQLSPTKAGYSAPTASADAHAPPGSPTRNKENTPPALPRSPKKEQTSFMTQAAQSRAEPYRTRDAAELAPPRPAYVQRGLNAEDLEILAKPSVKRLANVTQLCKLCGFFCEVDDETDMWFGYRFSRLLL